MRAWLLRFMVIGTTAIALLGLAPRVAGAYASLRCVWSFPDTAHVTISWTMAEDPQMPIGPPFAGWDVQRSSTADCGSPVTINPEMFPRDSGNTRTYVFTDEPPPGVYRYRIVPVNAQRGMALISPYICDNCHHGTFDISVPDLAAPVCVGTIGDDGWTLMVQACPGTCYYSGLIDGINITPALRPYADGSTVIRLYGYASCCTIEGPVVIWDHFEVGRCLDVVPVKQATWGSLKTLYR